MNIEVHLVNPVLCISVCFASLRMLGIVDLCISTFSPGFPEYNSLNVPAHDRNHQVGFDVFLFSFFFNVTSSFLS